MICADVLVPAPVGGLFSYLVPGDWESAPQAGEWVVVPFGPSRHVLGLVSRIRARTEQERSLKHLSAKAPETPASERSIRFWKWMSEYYMCHPGEVLMAALPGGFKLENRSRIRAIPAENAEDSGLERELSPAALELYRYLLDAGETELRALEKQFESKHISLSIKELLENSWAELDGSWDRKVPERIQWVVKRNPEGEVGLWNSIVDARKPPKQAELLVWLDRSESANGIERSVLNKMFSPSALKSLIEKGLLQLEARTATDINEPAENLRVLQELSEAQQTALEAVRAGFSSQKTVLLLGVTASGKTELYAHLIRDAFEAGRSALFLLPEIALTTQMIRRMERLFGSEVMAYHSRLSERERLECFRKVLKADRPFLVLGARSALLLPFRTLGLVVVDEEHETSYKQSDPAPRYQARDSALMLGRFHECPVLLGSATPSLESMMLSQEGKFAYVALRERFNKQELPRIGLSRFRPKPAGGSEPETALGEELLEAVSHAIEHGRQALLFQNRRGFSPYVQCSDCGEVPGCPQCDISLTLHRSSGRLRCHYCGHSEAYQQACTHCGSISVHFRGFGTQRLEEEIAERKPDWRLARIDLDSTRSKNALSEVLDAFESGELDLLVGTQMVTKGLDFKNVSVVGVVDADALVRQPDFRAEERSFQLLAQVAGRAGRGSGEGRVLIQTANPALDLYKDLRDGDFDSIYRRLLYRRMLFRYPPYCRLIRVLLLHAEPERVERGARMLGASFKEAFKDDILGPETPSVARLRGMHQRQFLLKIDREHSPSSYKNRLASMIENAARHPNMKGIRILVDVDP